MSISILKKTSTILPKGKHTTLVTSPLITTNRTAETKMDDQGSPCTWVDEQEQEKGKKRIHLQSPE